MALVRGKVRQRSLKEIQNDIISWGVIILSLKTDEIKQYQRRKNTEKTVCWLLFLFLVSYWQSLFHEKSFCVPLFGTCSLWEPMDALNQARPGGSEEIQCLRNSCVLSPRFDGECLLDMGRHHFFLNLHSSSLEPYFNCKKKIIIRKYFCSFINKQYLNDMSYNFGII